MSFRLIEAEKAEHRVSRLCGVLEVTRQGYYAWRARGPSPRELRDRELERILREAFAASRETYGAPRGRPSAAFLSPVRFGPLGRPDPDA